MLPLVEPFVVCLHRNDDDRSWSNEEERMARRAPPRKVTYFDPVAPRLGRNTIIESTFEVGRRFRCTMRVDCGQIDPGMVIQPVLGDWQPHIPERLDEEELEDWRTGR